MSTKTTISLSPIKRCSTSPNLKKRRIITSILANRKLSLTISNMISSPKTSSVCYRKQKLNVNNLPDLVNDILIEEQKRQDIISHIALTLRKVGDQVDQQFQIQDTLLSTEHKLFPQRTIKFVHCITNVFRFFL